MTVADLPHLQHGYQQNHTLTLWNTISIPACQKSRQNFLFFDVSSGDLHYASQKDLPRFREYKISLYSLSAKTPVHPSLMIYLCCGKIAKTGEMIRPFPKQKLLNLHFRSSRSLHLWPAVFPLPSHPDERPVSTRNPASHPAE